MVGEGLSPDEAVSTIRRTIEESGLMPDEVTYVEEQPGDENRDVKLPAVVLQPLSSVRLTRFNTDRADYLYGEDDEGSEVIVGRVFISEYTMSVQLDIWTAAGSSYDERELGEKLYDALYVHDSHGPEQSFLDEDGEPIESIWRFRIDDSEPANDLTGTPTLRRWRQDVSLWSYHRFDTTEDYMTDVDVPTELTVDDDGMLTSE